jgi:hypothetical protein
MGKAAALAMTKRNKYGAVKTVYAGVRYDSKAEALWARDLRTRKAVGEVFWYQRQVKAELGEQVVAKIDFLVSDADGVHYEEVKGYETPSWRRVVKWWKVYGPAPLWVCKRKGKKWTVDVIQGVKKCDDENACHG